MTSFVDLVMQAAAIEMLNDEAAQIEQELQQLLAEAERSPVEERNHDVFWGRFMELLKHRGEVCRKTMILARWGESERHARDDQRRNAGMGVGALHDGEKVVEAIASNELESFAYSPALDRASCRDGPVLFQQSAKAS